MNGQNNKNNDFVCSEEELIELLTSVYTLGYLKACEKFMPGNEIYNTEEDNNG